MARIEKIKLFKDSYLETRSCYLVSGYLTLDDVNNLNETKEPIFLIMENTIGQNSNIIGYLDSKMIDISVVGGLDYVNKSKYELDSDVMRTIYSPQDLCNIIKVFEEIERNINSSWKDIEKCLYVYKCIVEGMNYVKSDSEIENELIYSSNLNGLLFRQADDVGLSIIFKEAMDRLGIECYYQCVKDVHSWNVLNLDGKYRVVDICWEVCNKTIDGACNYRYFCRLDGSKFYDNKYHDISNDQEEIHFPAIPLDDDVLISCLEHVLNSKYMISGNMIYYKNKKNEEFYYFLLGESHGHLVYVIRYKDFINYFYLDKDIDIKTVLDNKKLSIACSKYSHNITGGVISKSVKRFSRYMREDGSNFLVCYSSAKAVGSIKGYIVIEPYTIGDKKVLIRSKISSENNLVDLKNSDFKKVIANELLSRRRLKRRIDNYNGYVGYIDEKAFNLG